MNCYFFSEDQFDSDLLLQLGNTSEPPLSGDLRDSDLLLQLGQENLELPLSEELAGITLKYFQDDTFDTTLEDSLPTTGALHG